MRPMSLLICALGGGLLGACSKASDEAEKVAAAAAAAGDQAEASAPPTAGPASAAPTTEAPINGCDRSPTLDLIPDAPLSGRVDGEPLLPRDVVLVQTLGEWTLRLYEARQTGDVVATGMNAGFQLARAPAEGQIDVQPLRAGSGSWLAGQEVNQNNTSRGAEGWALQLDRVVTRPWRADGGEIQEVGRATGRLAFVRRGDGGRCLWVAGRFEASIRFVGPPGALADEAAPQVLPQAATQPARDDTDRARRARSEWERRKAIKEVREKNRY